jgi:23S rRNA (uracil1939-C5)-methyltransferase
MIQQKLLRGPLLLEDVHSSGRCVGVADGKHIYFEGGIPGETVTFTMGRRKQGFHAGKIEEFLEASPYRTTPFCPHYAVCGGCPWQHIDYARQLELKHRILQHALLKYGIITPPVPPVIPSPETSFFRHRMEYSFTAAARTDNLHNGSPQPALGFHSIGEPGRVNAIHTCFLQAEPSRLICDFVERTALQMGLDFYDHENKSGFLRSLSIRINTAGEALVVVGFNGEFPARATELLARLSEAFPRIVSLNYTIHLSPAHSQLQGEIVPVGKTEPFLYENLAGYRFRIHATSFFQPNARQAGKIFLTARDWAGLQGYERVYDLYTGVGTLALVLAPVAGRVTGIEGSSLAIEDAAENARINGIEQAEFLTGDILETFKSTFLAEHGRPDFIVLDPPRSGTLIEIKKTINNSGARKVLYLSCNPVSLAFDLKQLTEVYHITRIQPFDMLPHTHHLETLVLMERQ